ncbi:TPA: ChaN family lipoprotein [Vibrio alginolyticus]|uniref:ChaN family lipoprotein n=1 Tax=Vibrio alginolyticus TaxID=663 RepID=UPI0012ADDD7D|nr:ChaN family lipoprotein [Vibrio alginolyticus]MDG2785149.1 ChaN family lipoprotein [Vibrio parahaemolyticus]EJX1245811.1 ChaN family lipoprotein [Vibrio alginolyticus]ELB2747731.1 ChaN family lipoprotein [Vibrio alginolyticus]MBS9929105.1 ChaN family lipoprotein [Vibrio alginolyticus]MCS0147860.1 ChaN family lipoprotein [Vibrio alginolyticus]
MRFSTLSLLFAGLLTGCSSYTHTDSHATSAEVTSFYDYQLYTPSGEHIALSKLPIELQQADVILIGEWHTHAGVHRFQTDMLKQLTSYDRSLALSMEQFTRDKQPVVDAYLRGEIGEQYLMKQANAWPNYESDYRPLVEFAKQKNLPVIAANAPKNIVRCIGRQGLDYINKLDDDQRMFIAQAINTGSSPYKEKFMASMHHGKPEQTEKQFAAQVTWDETMAESIVSYLDDNPGAQIVHVAGKFHTEQGLGTAASILSRNPSLKVVVISPTDNVLSDNTDYQLEVLAPPVRYVQDAHRMAAYQHLTKRNNDLQCK